MKKKRSTPVETSGMRPSSTVGQYSGCFHLALQNEKKNISITVTVVKNNLDS